MPKKGVVPPQLRAFLFRKGHHKVHKSASHTTVSGKSSMAKRRGGRRRGRSFRSRFHKPKLAILPMLGFGVAVYKPIEYGLRVGTTPQQKLTEVVRGFGVNFLAYDYEQGKFNTGGLANAYVPIIAGVVAHKILNFTGVNRMLSRHIKVTL